MILGNGDISHALIMGLVDRPMVIYFASGVSNSKQTRLSEFEREYLLLRKQNTGLHMVYFSSLCIYYSHETYSNHKRFAESIIRGGMFESYTIVRIGNITWGNNPNTIINFFKAEHAAGRTPELQDTYRHLITKDEFIYWMKLIPVGTKNEMNIPGRMIKVKDIWEEVKQGKL